MTFGYSTSTAPCAVITTIASWSATLVKGGNPGTTSTTTASSTSLPNNAYLCFDVVVTAVSSKLLWLVYDGSSYPTNLNTPTISVPEPGLALMGLALLAPLVGRRRKREYKMWRSLQAAGRIWRVRRL